MCTTLAGMAAVSTPPSNKKKRPAEETPVTHGSSKKRKLAELDALGLGHLPFPDYLLNGFSVIRLRDAVRTCASELAEKSGWLCRKVRDVMRSRS